MRTLSWLLPFGIAVAAVPAPAAAAAAPAVAVAPALPFEHDFAAGLARARTERKPVFVEAWAPW